LDNDVINNVNNMTPLYTYCAVACIKYFIPTSMLGHHSILVMLHVVIHSKWDWKVNPIECRGSSTITEPSTNIAEELPSLSSILTNYYKEKWTFFHFAALVLVSYKIRGRLNKLDTYNWNKLDNSNRNMLEYSNRN
jgi:hypothetical protein